VRSLRTLGPPLVAGVYLVDSFPFRKLRLATASLQYQNGSARVLLRHLKQARLLVGWLCLRPGYGSCGRESAAERSDGEVENDVRAKLRPGICGGAE